MKMKKTSRFTFAFMLSLSIFMFAACGGNGGASLTNGINKVYSNNQTAGITYTLKEEKKTGYVSEIWPENEGRKMDAYTVDIKGDLNQEDFDDDFTIEGVAVKLNYKENVKTIIYNTTEYTPEEANTIVINVLRKSPSGDIVKIKENYGTSYVAYLDDEDKIVYEFYIITNFFSLNIN